MGGHWPHSPLFLFGIIILVLWSLLWTGLALWRAAKRGEKLWFIIFLLVHTAGILEIIYIFLVTGGKLSDFTKGPGQIQQHHHEHSEHNHSHA